MTRWTPSAATASAASWAASSRVCSACPGSPGPSTAAFCTPATGALLGSQVLGILVTIAFVAIADVVLGLIIKACFKGSLRVSAEDEAAGLDVAVHGESAYPAYLGLD